uniref:Uncharacterized protein n=1 Tax=Arundo donax TaxID=35708 RepID=A0A0A9B118_ARUDO
MQGAAAAVGRRRRRRGRGFRRGGVHGAASRRLPEPGPEAGGEGRGGGRRRAAGDGGGEELLEQHTEPGERVVGAVADVSGGTRARGVLAGAGVLTGGTWTCVRLQFSRTNDTVNSLRGIKE